MLVTDDFFRDCSYQLIDLRHPLVVLANHMPWRAVFNASRDHTARAAETEVSVTPIASGGRSGNIRHVSG
jgi:hypothetical protein